MTAVDESGVEGAVLWWTGVARKLSVGADIGAPYIVVGASTALGPAANTVVGSTEAFEMRAASFFLFSS